MARSRRRGNPAARSAATGRPAPCPQAIPRRHALPAEAETYPSGNCHNSRMPGFIIDSSAIRSASRSRYSNSTCN